MKEFLSFYRWGLNMKFHMAIYTLALVFFKALVNLYQGESGVASITMLQMLIVSTILAIKEVVLFPAHKELEPAALKGRTILWGIAANVLMVGGALLFDWFAGVPVWMAALLGVALEGGLFAMWFGIHAAQKRDTDLLNKGLKSFQAGQ